MPESDDFTQIMKVSPSQSHDELSRLFESYRPALMAKARRLLHCLPWLQGKYDASDAVQETLFAAFRSNGQFQGDETHRLAWLTGILSHRIADQCRRYACDKRTSAKEMRGAETMSQLLEAIPSTDPTPSSVCRRQENVQEIHRALERLAPEHRVALLRRARDECTFEQIADELICGNVQAARRLYKRALENLELLLRSHGPNKQES